jgi:hypothetical protein
MVPTTSPWGGRERAMRRRWGHWSGQRGAHYQHDQEDPEPLDKIETWHWRARPPNARFAYLPRRRRIRCWNWLEAISSGLRLSDHAARSMI